MVMSVNTNLIHEFHEAFGCEIRQPQLISDIEYVKLRVKLIQEETKELTDQLWDDCQSGIISANLLKEMADVLYVVYGLGVGLGLPVDEALIRVHKSNMSKLGDDGKPIYREDGKVLKGPNYKPPVLDDLV